VLTYPEQAQVWGFARARLLRELRTNRRNAAADERFLRGLADGKRIKSKAGRQNTVPKLIVANAHRMIDPHVANSRPGGAQREDLPGEACGGDDALQQQNVPLLEAVAEEHASEFLKLLPMLSLKIEVELTRLKPDEAGEVVVPYKPRRCLWLACKEPRAAEDFP
jgi:hypothetical protein